MGRHRVIGGGVTTLTAVASATGDSTTQVAVPGTAQAGDLGVMFDYAGSGAAGGVPSGWTGAQSVTGSGGTAIISYKKLVGGDVGATITGLTTAAIRRQTIVVFRPDNDIDAVADGSGGGYSDIGDPPDQTVAMAAQATPVLAAAQMGATGTIDLGSSPAFSTTIDNPGTDQRVGYRIYNSSPADHTITATGDGGSKVVVSTYIRVS